MLVYGSENAVLRGRWSHSSPGFALPLEPGVALTADLMTSGSI